MRGRKPAVGKEPLREVGACAERPSVGPAPDSPDPGVLGVAWDVGDNGLFAPVNCVIHHHQLTTKQKELKVTNYTYFSAGSATATVAMRRGMRVEQIIEFFIVANLSSEVSVWWR